MNASIAAIPIPSSPVEVRHSADRTPAVEPVVVEPLEARDLAGWTRFVRRHREGTFFHTITWMHSVRDTFGHTPRYLVAKRGNRMVGVLPLFEVRSLLGGTMLLSVPYAVEGGMLVCNEEVSRALVDEAVLLATEVGARSIDFRSAVGRVEGWKRIDRYVNFRRELPDKPEEVLGWLPRKARAAARNGENKYDLQVEFSHENLKPVWRLYCRSMRRLGSLAYPYQFFDELCERDRRNCIVQVVRKDGHAIGGLVSFRFNGCFTPYFVGCDERFNRLGTNNFVYMTAMRKAVELGCRTFDFGRTRIDNKGSFDFKRFHGFEPTPLEYQRWEANGQEAVDLSPSNPAFSLARRVWKHLPLPMCTWLGGRVSKHIPG